LNRDFRSYIILLERGAALAVLLEDWTDSRRHYEERSIQTFVDGDAF
jgi:hypothetical protein